jgi:hypothetical protein
VSGSAEQEHWLKRGVVQRRSDGAWLPYETRRLDENDLNELHRLHELIQNRLPHPHVFRHDGRDFLERHLQQRGGTFGAFCEGELIAYAVVSLPGYDDDNLARDLPELDIPLDEVALYDGSAVHPNYRGSRLHSELNTLRAAYAGLRGCHHLMGTVSIFNPYSLRNHFAAGFFIKGIGVKYGGMWRLIIHRDQRYESVTAIQRLAELSPDVIMWCHIEDVEAQTKVLGAGAWGFRLCEVEGRPSICYTDHAEYVLPLLRCSENQAHGTRNG